MLILKWIFVCPASDSDGKNTFTSSLVCILAGITLYMISQSTVCVCACWIYPHPSQHLSTLACKEKSSVSCISVQAALWKQLAPTGAIRDAIRMWGFQIIKPRKVAIKWLHCNMFYFWGTKCLDFWLPVYGHQCLPPCRPCSGSSLAWRPGGWWPHKTLPAWPRPWQGRWLALWRARLKKWWNLEYVIACGQPGSRALTAGVWRAISEKKTWFQRLDRWVAQIL